MVAIHWFNGGVRQGSAGNGLLYHTQCPQGVARVDPRGTGHKLLIYEGDR